MNYKALKVAVIGLGRMGQRHIEALQKQNMTICGLVDISESAQQEVAKKFSISSDYCFSDAKQMLIEQQPEALVIATTAPTHAEYTIMAAHNNVKYILCEKPIAISLNETHGMLDACSHYGAKLAINHQMRFLPQYTEIKALIDKGDFGPLSSIHVLGSNFGLAMNASHYFEMFRFLTQTKVFDVQAWFESDKLPNPRGKQFEDYSGTLVARNEEGVKMFIDFSAHAGHGLQVAYIFKYGQIIVDELSGFARSICRKNEFKELPTTRYGMPDDVVQFQIKPFEMIDSTIKVWETMLSGANFPDHEVGLHALQCLLAAIESNENNNRVVALNNLSIDPSRTFKWA